CNTIAGLDGLKFDHNPPANPCATTADCNDQNPCTADACTAEGVCSFEPIADGMSPAEAAGDCKASRCRGGKQVDDIDDQDVGSDDEDCTSDGGNQGTPSHTAKPDKPACTKDGMAGLCAFGKCVIQCGPELPCDDGESCTVDTCGADGVCSFMPLSTGSK